MSHWARKYTDDQRSAVERAALDLRIRPMTAIKRMAAAGELKPRADAEPLEPFEIPAATVSSIAKQAERRKLGKSMPRDLAKLPARDRAEHLQRRLTGIIDYELERVEKDAKRGRKIDGEHLRRLARAIRELGTLPDAKDMRLPRTPGDRVPGTGEQPDNRTLDSMAGKLLAASDRHAAQSDPPRQDSKDGEHAPAQPQATTEITGDAQADEKNARTHDQDRDDEVPGSAQRAHAGALAASGVVLGA